MFDFSVFKSVVMHIPPQLLQLGVARGLQVYGGGARTRQLQLQAMAGVGGAQKLHRACSLAYKHSEVEKESPITRDTFHFSCWFTFFSKGGAYV